jgi:hypothetical protein
MLPETSFQIINMHFILAIQSERSSSVHNFETSDNLPFINNAATQSFPLFSKKIKHNFLRISDKKCQMV